MPSNNSGGPWGQGGGGNRGNNGGGRPPSGGGGGGQRPPQVPDIDEIVRKGQDQLRVLMGGRGNGTPNRGNDGGEFKIGRQGWLMIALAVAVLWLFLSLYRVDTSEQSVELLFGEYLQTGEEGLNFAPWPVVTYEKFAVTRENTEDIGVGRGSRLDEGLMLTGDENIVDIDFQVVWNVNDLQKFLFNIAGPQETIRAVSESAMREIIARSQLAPILNRDRGVIAQELQELIQATLDSYESGINVVRVNFDRADPPREVIDAFREVQAAEQERDTLEKQADAYANSVVAQARGTAAQVLEEAEAYRARVVNEAEGEASRFIAVYDEFAKAPEVTRKRLYLETLERVLGDVDKVIIDSEAGGDQGVVPYLPLNELNRSRTTANAGGTNQ
ncbi:MAG: FtsH protease activity modulator HflK [Pseudomonadota bacterium]